MVSILTSVSDQLSTLHRLTRKCTLSVVLRDIVYTYCKSKEESKKLRKTLKLATLKGSNVEEEEEEGHGLVTVMVPTGILPHVYLMALKRRLHIQFVERFGFLFGPKIVPL